MTPEQIALLTPAEREMLERAEKATPGPWEFWAASVMRRNTVLMTLETREHFYPVCQHCDNIDFAAHARTDLPATLETIAGLRATTNTPELHDFATGVVSEAQHQRARWGSDHDAGKLPEDWFWLLGYLSGKCLAAYNSGDTNKALHHMISTAAALANWHAAILGQTNMRPGLSEVATAALALAGAPQRLPAGVSADAGETQPDVCSECGGSLVHVSGKSLTAVVCPVCDADSSAVFDDVTGTADDFLPRGFVDAAKKHLEDGEQPQEKPHK